MFNRRAATRTEARSGPSATIEVIDDSNFAALTAGRPTVIDLWAPWCAPCRSFRPIFDAVAAKWDDDVRFGTCNVDENPDTAALLQVQSIPTVIAFAADGSELDRLVGVPSSSRFDAFVAQAAAGGGGSQFG